MKKRIIYLLIGLLLAHQGYNQNIIYSLLQDANGDISLSTYNPLTNTLVNSFNLNSTSLANGFEGDASIYDSENNTIIILNNLGVVSHIDVATGVVSDYTIPFDYDGGFNLALFHDNESQTIYSLLKDANGDISLSTYNPITNTLANSFNLNSTSLANGFEGDASIYDSKNQTIIIFNNNSLISHIDVATGVVTDYTPPFEYDGGFNWALFYDNESQTIYSLLEDSNGDISLSTYNSTTNTLTNSLNLNSTSLTNGFEGDASIYDSENNTIIIFNNNSMISFIDVETGTVSDYSPPFEFNGGFNWVLFTDENISNNEFYYKTPNFFVFPNPVINKLNVKFENNNERIIILINSNGQTIIVNKEVGSFYTFDVSTLITGEYILIVKEQGQIIARKLIIE